MKKRSHCVHAEQASAMSRSVFVLKSSQSLCFSCVSGHILSVMRPSSRVIKCRYQASSVSQLTSALAQAQNVYENMCIYCHMCVNGKQVVTKPTFEELQAVIETGETFAVDLSEEVRSAAHFAMSCVCSKNLFSPSVAHVLHCVSVNEWICVYVLCSWLHA